MSSIFDKFKKDDTPPQAKADFSNVRSGGSSTAPAAPVPDQPTITTIGGARTYVVVKGDSLSKIAQREYGDANKWRAIHEANKDLIKDPDLIYPGQELKIPGA
jgi:nucleoid-associated protein YgaU